MEISSLTVKLIILLVPGIIAYFIYKRLTSRAAKKSDFLFLIIAIFLGILSYLSLQIIQVIICFVENICGDSQPYKSLQTFKSISTDENIPYFEVIPASILSIAIAYVLALMDTKNIVNRLGVYLKVTNKESDDTLYLSYLTKEEINVVYIRDPKNNITYFGKVFSFSEKEGVKEIVLEDVSLFTYDEGISLYEVNSVYLNIENGMTIEQASLKKSKK